MKARKSGQESDADEDFFHSPVGSCSGDPSLYSLWQLLNTTPLPSLKAGMKDPDP